VEFISLMTLFNVEITHISLAWGALQQKGDMYISRTLLGFIEDIATQVNGWLVGRWLVPRINCGEIGWTD